MRNKLLVYEFVQQNLAVSSVYLSMGYNDINKHLIDILYHLTFVGNKQNIGDDLDLR